MAGLLGSVMGLFVGAVGPAMAEAQAPAQARWTASGPVWQPDVPQQIIEEERVQHQQGTGCGSSDIRFGDTAAMRDQAAEGSMFPDEVRQLSSAATITDDAGQADGFMTTAIAMTTDPIQAGHLVTLQALQALQHGRPVRAREILSGVDIAALPPPVASDVLFLTVLAEAEGATADTWRERQLPVLDEAARLDPTSFQVRAWRVIGWLEAEPWRVGPAAGACAALGRDFATRLLDLSEAGSCPVMLGHLELAIGRHFRERTSGNPGGGRMIWQQFATGLFATVVGDERTRLAMHGALAATDAPCAALLATELAQVGDR